MAWLPNPIACDVCEMVKQDSNHWYYAELLPREHENATFQVWPWGTTLLRIEAGRLFTCAGKFA